MGPSQTKVSINFLSLSIPKVCKIVVRFIDDSLRQQSYHVFQRRSVRITDVETEVTALLSFHDCLFYIFCFCIQERSVLRQHYHLGLAFYL